MLWLLSMALAVPCPFEVDGATYEVVVNGASHEVEVSPRKVTPRRLVSAIHFVGSESGEGEVEMRSGALRRSEQWPLWVREFVLTVSRPCRIDQPGLPVAPSVQGPATSGWTSREFRGRTQILAFRGDVEPSELEPGRTGQAAEGAGGFVSGATRSVRIDLQGEAPLDLDGQFRPWGQQVVSWYAERTSPYDWVKGMSELALPNHEGPVTVVAAAETLGAARGVCAQVSGECRVRPTAAEPTPVMIQVDAVGADSDSVRVMGTVEERPFGPMYVDRSGVALHPKKPNFLQALKLHEEAERMNQDTSQLTDIGAAEAALEKARDQMLMGEWRVARRLAERAATLAGPSGRLAALRTKQEVDTLYDLNRDVVARGEPPEWRQEPAERMVMIYGVSCAFCGPALKGLDRERLQRMNLSLALVGSGYPTKVKAIFAEESETNTLYDYGRRLGDRLNVSSIPRAFLYLEGSIRWTGHPARLDKVLDRLARIESGQEEE